MPLTIKEINQIERQLGVPKIRKCKTTKKQGLQNYIAIKYTPMHIKQGMKIGVLKNDIPSLSSYKKGELVLYTPYTVQEAYNNMLWDDMKKFVQKCTIEVPSSWYFKGESNISTIKTMVGVPLSYIAYEINI